MPMFRISWTHAGMSTLWTHAAPAEILHVSMEKCSVSLHVSMKVKFLDTCRNGVLHVSISNISWTHAEIVFYMCPSRIYSWTHAGMTISCVHEGHPRLLIGGETRIFILMDTCSHNSCMCPWLHVSMPWTHAGSACVQ